MGGVADLRARLARSQGIAARSAAPVVERLDGSPAPPGWEVWRVGGPGGPCTMLPALAPAAPPGLRRRYLARIVATCTGTCALCGAVAGLPPHADPRRPAAWAALPLEVALAHSPSCPCVFTGADKRFFDPRVVGR